MVGFTIVAAYRTAPHRHFPVLSIIVPPERLGYQIRQTFPTGRRAAMIEVDDPDLADALWFAGQRREAVEHDTGLLRRSSSLTEIRRRRPAPTRRRRASKTTIDCRSCCFRYLFEHTARL
jgi:hypothetical protein